MPYESTGAVTLLEARLSPRSREPHPEPMESFLTGARALLEAPHPGREWSPAGGGGFSGRLVLADAAEAFPFVHRLRTELRADPAGPPLQLVAGLGRGEEMEASRLAGEAFRTLVRKRRWLTQALTTDPDSNLILGAFCRTLDSLVDGWTDAQWQAVHRRDRGQTLQRIGEDLGIAYQNVSKRLIAARYALLEEVLAAASLAFAKA